MEKRLRILIVDDDEGDRWQIKRALKKAGVSCECTETRNTEEAVAACQAGAFDCAIIDYQLPGSDGLAGITALHDLCPYMAIIMSTGQGDEMVAADAMKRGACDYISKTSLDAQSMWGRIENAVDRASLEQKIAQQREELQNFNRKLAMIFQTVGMGDWSWDIAKDEITAHPIVWAQYGLPGVQGTGPAAWFRERQNAADAAASWGSIKDGVQTRQPFDTEFRVVWPDGSVHWLASHGVVVVDHDNKPIQTHGLNIDVTERKMAELRLQESERQLRQQANAMPQIVWTSGPDLTNDVDSYNDRWYEYTGLSRQETMKSGWQAAVHPNDLESCIGIAQREFKGGVGFELECRLRRASDGAYCWHLARFVPYRDDCGTILRWFGTFTDIHEQRTSRERLEVEVLKRTSALQLLQSKEEQLEVSLSEQTTLLKEVHHRVKNNLQVISSLLRMQGELLTDPAATEALRQSQNRVSSMALIHEQLYGDRDTSQIDFAHFTQTLVGALFHSYCGSAGHITSRLNIAPVTLKVDEAIPCGLILNELVTNALKYAYPDGKRGEIVVELKETDDRSVVLSVSDQGVGLKGQIDWNNSASLGLTLVNTLTDQLGGKLSVKSGPGAEFTVAFAREVQKPAANLAVLSPTYD
jgi:PAS domain S-box-containing protein